MENMSVFLLWVAAYLIGSIPFGVILGWLIKGVDIRDYGSGNIGYANAERVLGGFWSKAVLILDILKGTVVIYYARNYLSLNEWQISIIGLFAVLGHIKSVWLKFKGGKAVSTTCGVILAIKPLLAIIGLVIYIFVKKITKTSAIGSLCSLILTLGLSIVFCITGQLNIIYLGLFMLLGATIVFLHLSHIRNFIQKIKNKRKQKQDTQNVYI